MSNKTLQYFEQISAIPHGSGNEKQLSDFLIAFAKENNLECFQDKQNNVIIKKSASKGYENATAVILQGHIDMVCEKSNLSNHDFSKDSLKLIYDGDFLHADQTTLGADDGIAVAMCMSILTDTSLVNPPIEILLTTDEEVGMCGANSLDASKLTGKMLINIDSEEEGKLLVSCAGGSRVTINLPINHNVLAYKNAYTIGITDLLGGHSGMEIIKQRANANILMGRLLTNLYEKMKFNISSIDGGAKDNAIARDCFVTILTDNSQDEIAKSIAEFQEIINNEFASVSEKISVSIKNAVITSGFSDTETSRIISILTLIPNGIFSMDKINDGLVESSTNLGVVKTTATDVVFTNAVRSSILSRRYEIENKMLALAKLCAAEFIKTSEYPAWEYINNSPLRDIFIKKYEQMFEKTPEITTIHAGLECGLFAQKMQNIDMISFGPNIFDVHTPQEKISVSSVNRMYDYLVGVLNEIAISNVNIDK